MRQKYLDKVYGRQLHKAWIDGITAKDAFHKVFDGPNPHCALSTVQKKFNWFNRASKDERSATKEKPEKEIEKYYLPLYPTASPHFAPPTYPNASPSPKPL